MSTEPTQPDETTQPEEIIRLDGITVTASTRIAALTSALDNLLREAKGMFVLANTRGGSKVPPHWKQNNAMRFAAQVIASSDMELTTQRHEEQAMSRLFLTLLEQSKWDRETGIVTLPVFSVGVHPSTSPDSAPDAVLMALALSQPVGLVVSV